MSHHQNLMPIDSGDIEALVRIGNNASNNGKAETSKRLVGFHNPGYDCAIIDAYSYFLLGAR